MRCDIHGGVHRRVFVDRREGHDELLRPRVYLADMLHLKHFHRSLIFFRLPLSLPFSLLNRIPRIVW